VQQLLVIQHAMRMRHSVICGLPLLLYFSTLCHKRYDFCKNKLLNTRCVLWFSLQILPETFLILRRNERDMVKMCIGLQVKYPLFLFDFIETLFFWTDFWKIRKYQISWKTVQWEPSCSMRTDGLTDRHDEANSGFSKFC